MWIIEGTLTICCDEMVTNMQHCNEQDSFQVTYNETDNINDMVKKQAIKREWSITDDGEIICPRHTMAGRL